MSKEIPMRRTNLRRPYTNKYGQNGAQWVHRMRSENIAAREQEELVASLELYKPPRMIRVSATVVRVRRKETA